MVEWSITVVLKTTVLRGTGGSNPSLSAKKKDVKLLLGVFFFASERALTTGRGFLLHFVSQAAFGRARIPLSPLTKIGNRLVPFFVY